MASCVLPYRPHMMAASSLFLYSCSPSSHPSTFLSKSQLLFSQTKHQLASHSCFCTSDSVAAAHPEAPTPSQLEADTRTHYALAIGAKVIPHPEKVAKGGEDAFFVGHCNGDFMAIADGVSGWAEENVDPALFSKELMGHAAALACSDEEVQDNPKLLLQKSRSATVSVGAATAIVAILEPIGTLHIANLGDCGLRIIRRGQIVFGTSPQQHYFDCPFQFSSTIEGQDADDAMVYEISMMDGDTVVMGSDGLFDNLYDADITSTVSIFGGPDKEAAERTASALAAMASRNARDKNYMSPYIQEAMNQGHDLPFWKKLFGKKLTGGKLDDITVLVGHVVQVQKLTDHGDMESLSYGNFSESSIVSSLMLKASEADGNLKETATRLWQLGVVSTKYWRTHCWSLIVHVIKQVTTLDIPVHCDETF